MNCKNEIKLSSEITKDVYTDYIQEHFDLQVEDVMSEKIPFNFDIKELSDWNIGLICGGSGSGKTTILKKLGNIVEPTFDESKSLISNFSSLPPSEAVSLLCSVGLCSVPTWLKPFHVLSNGEMYRARLAKSVYDAKEGEIILVDEFTSVVDRDVAKTMSFAVQKLIRKKNLRIVFASCHYDIIEWLMPNWIYDLNKGGVLEKYDSARRPTIELQMYRTETDTWEMFKKHHYMTEELNKSAACYVFTWNDKVVAFVGVLPQPSGYYEKGVRGTRTVVLPSFQGIGIGSKVTEFVASIYKADGYRYFTKTVNPKLGEYRSRSENWLATAKNGRPIRKSNSKLNKKQKLRASYCHEYVGKPLRGCQDVIQNIKYMRETKNGYKQLCLFDF